MNHFQTHSKLRAGFLPPILAVVVLAAVSCSAFQKGQETVSGCLLSKSIISIDVPPITLTPSRTAAERQLIGENRELEPNGWLIASSRAVPRASARLQELEAARRFYRELSVLEFYDETLQELRAGGVLGEDAQGHLTLVPEDAAPRQGRFKNRDEIDSALRIAAEINRSRDWLYENGAKAAGGNNPVERGRFKEKVRPGEWIKDERGAWKRR